MRANERAIRPTAASLALLLTLCASALAAANPPEGDGRTDLTELTLEELLDIEVTSVSRRVEKRQESLAGQAK